MNRSIRNFVSINKFAFTVRFYVVFVTEEGKVVFLCPSGVNVFLPFFVRLVFPKFIVFTFFDLLIFIAVVTLTGNFNKTRGNNLPLVDEQPYRSSIGNFISARQSEKIIKTLTVNNLFFRHFIANIV
jgi:hypothetical protein